MLSIPSHRMRLRKYDGIMYLGGKCVVTGYAKSLRAIDFHHVHPLIKSFNLSGAGRNKCWSSYAMELDKCIPVSGNVHREIHAGITMIPQHALMTVYLKTQSLYKPRLSYEEWHDLLPVYTTFKLSPRKRAMFAVLPQICALCGYDTHLGAIEAHHVDPDLKDPNNDPTDEARKCVSLCVICHRELHDGLVVLPDEILDYVYYRTKKMYFRTNKTKLLKSWRNQFLSPDNCVKTL